MKKGILFFAACLSLIVFATANYSIHTVRGNSMDNTLNDGDIVFAKKIWRTTRISHNDLVVGKSPVSEKNIYIKRCIGLPKDRIIIDQDSVYCNAPDHFTSSGDEIVIPYKDFSVYIDDINFEYYKNALMFIEMKDISSDRNVTFGNDYYFLAGDNRAYSIDSRYFGVVPRSRLYSIVIKRLGNIHDQSKFKNKLLTWLFVQQPE